MLVLIFVSGIGITYLRLQEGSAEKEGRRFWLGLTLAKFVLLVFLSPITDMIAFSWSASAN